MEIKIDYSKDKLLCEFSRITIKDRYMLPGEKSPQEAFAGAAKAFADDEEHAQRIYNYVSNQWFMFSSPILSNAGTKNGLPISCFLNYVDDSIEGLTDTFTENALLSTRGGGIGTYWGKVREIGADVGEDRKTLGVIPHVKIQDSQTLGYAQGVTRRGSAAAYLDITHPEIEEFLDIRKPTGDASRTCPNIHQGVLITDAFMELIDKCEKHPGTDDSWDLISPHTGKVVKTVSAKALWIKILHNRLETGEPYLVNVDRMNQKLPQFLKDQGLYVYQSNLCTEITLPTNAERTAVCCLSSLNLEHFYQWRNDEMFIPDLMRMLDNVLQYFIDNAPEGMWRAIESAIDERSVGLGAMGFHAFLQLHDIPFESLAARLANIQMFDHISSEAKRGDDILLAERGPCPASAGTDMECRFSHKMAIAPNATSSIMCDNTSPSTEPYPANIYVQKTKSGSYVYKNPYLEYVLTEHGQDTDEVWKSILNNKGSVQHLDFLTDHEKLVFKTSMEIDPMWIVEHADARGAFICQAQSMNIFLPADVDKEVLHRVHKKAMMAPNIKSMYYLRSLAKNRAESSQNKERHQYNLNQDDCLACEG